MKVIFLDFDGVLNCKNWLVLSDLRERKLLSEGTELTWEDKHTSQLNPASVCALSLLCTQAGAKVVITTSWRRIMSLEQLTECLQTNGFTGEIVDILPTPESLSLDRRGAAINHWIDNTEIDVSHYVILDDDIDYHMNENHVVRTMMLGGGLTYEKSQEAFYALQRERNYSV